LFFANAFNRRLGTAEKNGWDGRIRTYECQSQSLVPYRLATSHHCV
jgi:hypothetical protein